MSLLPSACLQDCWNGIGVWGDSSCPRLAECAHCRNCPVYSSAAAKLLHGEPPAEYLQEWRRRLAQPRVKVESSQSQAVMIFRLGGEWLALSATAFQEVAEPRPVHSLPHRRGGALEGLVNIRGELIVCVALGHMLGINAAGQDRQPGERERLLVVSTDGGRLAFKVHEAHGIVNFEADQLKPAPETLALASSRFTRGLLSWNGRSVGRLDDQFLFYTLNRSLG